MTSTIIRVGQGGTSVGSLTAYAPIFGGTTSANPVQSGTVGTVGQLLISNGAGALGTFQTLQLSLEKTLSTFSGGNVRYFTVSAPCNGTIINVTQTAQSFLTAGNYTIAINGVNVTGLVSITNSTGVVTTAATANNTFVIGDPITITFASSLTGVFWEGTLRYTKQ